MLQAESDSLPILIHGNHLDNNLLALLKNLTRMANLSRPGHIRDMEQAINSFFKLDKRPVICQVPHGTGNNRIGGVFFEHLVPRIFLRLLDAHGHLLFFRIDRKDHHLDLVADLDEFIGMIDPSCPGQFTDMNQPLDTRL